MRYSHKQRLITIRERYKIFVRWQLAAIEIQKLWITQRFVLRVSYFL